MAAPITPTNSSPNVLNYLIGKGLVFFKPEGGAYRDLGNAPTFEWTPTLTTLEHKSARQGINFTDRKVITDKTAQVHMILEEWTAENLGFAFLGDGASGTIDVYSLTEIKGSLLFLGQNDIGAHIELELPLVTVSPSGTLGMISDTWGAIDVTVDVLGDPDTGSFGTLVWNSSRTGP